jgi:hypothetical protein
MNAIWSFWSKPYFEFYRESWFNEKAFILSFALSVELARTHFQKTILITDSTGIELLIDKYGLVFDKVTNELDCLQESSTYFWVLGKLKAYSLQTEPFIHLDNDVFLWQKPPDHFFSSEVFSQSLEKLDIHDYCLFPLDVYIDSLKGYIPEEFIWAAKKSLPFMFNMGVFGGNNLEFIVQYSRKAMKMITDPINFAAWSRFSNTKSENLLIEQHFLYICVEYQKSILNLNFEMGYICEIDNDLYIDKIAHELGYTHLVANTKQNSKIIQGLEKYMLNNYITIYARTLRAL